MSTKIHKLEKNNNDNYCKYYQTDKLYNLNTCNRLSMSWNIPLKTFLAVLFIKSIISNYLQNLPKNFQWFSMLDFSLNNFFAINFPWQHLVSECERILLGFVWNDDYKTVTFDGFETELKDRIRVKFNKIVRNYLNLQ